jgi:hypothetical protein
MDIISKAKDSCSLWRTSLLTRIECAFFIIYIGGEEAARDK